MPDTPLNATRRALKAPRAAAIAGIIFAVLYGATMLLLYRSMPAYQVVPTTPGWRPMQVQFLWH